ncbi:hypothetical protein TNCT_119741 [Trichonephila clavata]|uniref:Uncharacterized protein n=1 Tax=Trichonephila clavata TaxID=2740835 RepID=A0A8X6LVW7_TRICU|nr:hypothetical protein TNCT_119741 [Trichonephila clavata]
MQSWILELEPMIYLKSRMVFKMCKEAVQGFRKNHVFYDLQLCKFKEVHGHSSGRPSCPQSRPATLLESFSFYLRNDPKAKHNPFRPRPSSRGIKKRLPPDDLSSSHPFWRWDTLLAIVPTGFCNTHGWRRELNIRCALLFLLRKLKEAFGKSVDTLQL